MAGIEAARLLRDIIERELEFLERGSTRCGQSAQSARNEMEPSDLSGGLEERSCVGSLAVMFR